MATTMRSVDTRFWRDGWVRKLNALDRYVFLYFLTNEHSTWCGVYEVDLSMIAFETGVDENDLKKSILPRLVPKIVYIDGWVVIKNFEKYHSNRSPQTQEGIKNAWKLVPPYIMAKISKIVIPPIYPLEGASPSTSTSTSTSTSSIVPTSGTPHVGSKIIFNHKGMAEEYDVQELEYVPIGGKAKSSNPYGKKVMAVLARRFAELAKIELGATFNASPWSAALSGLYQAHGKDPQKTMAFMERAVGYFESEGLSYTPHTLWKNMPMIDKWLAEKDKKYNSPLYE